MQPASLLWEFTRFTHKLLITIHCNGNLYFLGMADFRLRSVYMLLDTVPNVSHCTSVSFCPLSDSQGGGSMSLSLQCHYM